MFPTPIREPRGSSSSRTLGVHPLCRREPNVGHGIIFTGIPITEWLLVGYCDASFNNAAGQKSQLGLLIALSEKKSLVETCSSVCSILDWKSHRSRRVARSTLSAETIGADSCADTIQFFSAFIGMLIHGSSLRDVTHYLGWACATDCKSLHDSLSQDNPSTTEKRVLIDLAAIREAPSEVHENHRECPDKLLWVPSDWQLADPLTKLGKMSRLKCSMWMQKP